MFFKKTNKKLEALNETLAQTVEKYEKELSFYERRIQELEKEYRYIEVKKLTDVKILMKHCFFIAFKNKGYNDWTYYGESYFKKFIEKHGSEEKAVEELRQRIEIAINKTKTPFKNTSELKISGRIDASGVAINLQEFKPMFYYQESTLKKVLTKNINA